MMKTEINKKLTIEKTAFLILIVSYSFMKCNSLQLLLSFYANNLKFTHADLYQKIENKYKLKLGKTMPIIKGGFKRKKGQLGEEK